MDSKAILDKCLNTYQLMYKRKPTDEELVAYIHGYLDKNKEFSEIKLEVEETYEH